jgi:hypothetical protein
MSLVYPPVIKMLWTTCARCGRESSCCAKVQFRYGGWNSPTFERACFACASCRVKNMGHWKLAPGWQDEIPPEPQYDCEDW